MVNLKTTTVSYKVHKLIRKPEEEWSIVPNAQEAIIDENTWFRVQELRKNKRRPTATGKTSLFSGLVFCADCGSKLHFCAAKSLKANQEFFRCANYKSGRGECTIHYIRNVALEQIVSVAVSDLADFVACHESFFLQMMGKQQSAGKDQNIRSIKSDITTEKHRIDEIDRLIAKLYEDYFAGKRGYSAIAGRTQGSKPCYISTPHVCVLLDLWDVTKLHHAFLIIYLCQVFILYHQKFIVNISRHPDIHK